MIRPRWLDELLRRFVLGVTPCEYYGHDQSDWCHYETGARMAANRWLIERGEARCCFTCGEQTYRRVEWTLEVERERQSWE